ncbi:contractile injection system protein, VgrG/Pvc8 family, partial [Paenibacillus kobensis]|uniref:contractile injection system protein, VgrG/Pvc8 family n=1 Tax=Paenibacillus kobensis TaxID=59841 RepID=UPI0024829C55
MIDVGQLHVQSPYKIQRIEDIRFEWKPNEHGRMRLRGLVADTDNISSTVHATADDQITLWAKTEAHEKILFKGVIASVQTTSRNRVYTIELEATSSTILLDRTLHNRSFQDSGMSYESVIRHILTPYRSSDVLMSIGEQDAIGTPVYQYGETDWAFMKRLASQLNGVIYSDVYESKPRLYVGMPEGRHYTIPNETPYRASKNMKAYRQAIMSGENLPASEFFSYEIETGEMYAIGDRVTFRHKQLVVSEVSARMVGGLLRFTYLLSREEGVRSEPLYNNKLTGLSLSGKVLAVKGELVQLHLDIDKEQSIAKANWYPFAPPTGNVMYCMPQVGTHASLYLPDATGEKAMVISSVRHNGGECAKTGDPNNRYFGTEHGSELELTPSAINLSGGGQSPLKVTIDDATGVRITSPTRLTLEAMQDISLFTPKKVNILAQNLLVVKKQNA